MFKYLNRIENMCNNRFRTSADNSLFLQRLEFPSYLSFSIIFYYKKYFSVNNDIFMFIVNYLCIGYLLPNLSHILKNPRMFLFACY